MIFVQLYILNIIFRVSTRQEDESSLRNDEEEAQEEEGEACRVSQKEVHEEKGLQEEVLQRLLESRT